MSFMRPLPMRAASIKNIPFFCHLLCQMVHRLNGNIFCGRSVITPIFIKRYIRQDYFFYT